MSIGQDLLDVPMGDMIRDMAFAIADSQYQLDQSSMRTAEMMGGLQSVIDSRGNQTFDDSRVFFGYEYMTVEQALYYAIFDDSLTGALDEDSIRLKEVVLEIIEEMAKAEGSSASAVQPLRNFSRDTSANADISNALDTQVGGERLAEKVIRVPTRLSMMELGFTPTFYQFVDTIIEVKIAIRMTRERAYERTTSNATSDRQRSSGRSTRVGLTWPPGVKRSKSYRSNTSVQTTQVDATYSQKYSYSAEGASLLRTKMVPVPPPAVLTERIRGYMEVEEEARRRRMEALYPDADDGEGGP
ncbi:hypothetical protein FHR95_000805 [Halomonas fontilapidosi]|uniref:Uncharacterized protein n=1 Tax=Halomonas fontilapidosi TaxID=616675 RepID=A0A7W5DIV5_9GAMM|nr:hypothetical protein [Halomonas fontilapidosi]MBB3183264.1 hypothetical protein [Halomonas fontilapidosi]